MFILPEYENTGELSLTKRQNSTNDSTTTSSSSPAETGQRTWTYAVIGVIIGIFFLIGLLLLYHRIRKLKIAGRSPKYIPTQFLKNKWEAWKPTNKYANLNGDNLESNRDSTASMSVGPTIEIGSVNRNTSVRSVMTLPAYSQKPKDTEEVIGREGERAGIDTVIELPETGEEEEDRREAEMESLYQIRQARRRELAEREERRRERREAREQNDIRRLEQLRREDRARREQNSLTNLAQNSASNVNLTAESLIAEHNSRGRDRRVSSVSYAALGQVRHDGTRIRSNSHESEQSGLLGGAAPMGAHDRNGSNATLLSLGGLPQPRYRDRSDSAATSISSVISSFEEIDPPSDTAQPNTSRVATSSHSANGSTSDVGAEDVEVSGGMVISVTDSEDGLRRPPEYDGHDWGEAPEYREQDGVSRMSSFATAHSRSDALARADSAVSRTDNLSIITPSIYIQTPTGPNTPVSPLAVREEHAGEPEATRRT